MNKAAQLEVFKDLKELNTQKNREGVASLGGTLAGVKILDDAYRKGQLDGRIKLYHGTSKKGKEGIKVTGVRPPKNVESSFTARVLPDIDTKKLKNKTYFAKKRRVAVDVGVSSSLTKAERPALARLSIPYDKKLNRVANPELRGAKNAKEFTEKARKATPVAELLPNSFLKKTFKNFGEGTVTLEGGLGPRWVKGSDKYKKNSFKEFGRFVKKNPKVFATGAGKALAGTALIGAIPAYRLLKEKKDG